MLKGVIFNSATWNQSRLVFGKMTDTVHPVVAYFEAHANTIKAQIATRNVTTGYQHRDTLSYDSVQAEVFRILTEQGLPFTDQNIQKCIRSVIMQNGKDYAAKKQDSTHRFYSPQAESEFANSPLQGAADKATQIAYEDPWDKKWFDDNHLKLLRLRSYLGPTLKQAVEAVCRTTSIAEASESIGKTEADLNAKLRQVETKSKELWPQVSKLPPLRQLPTSSWNMLRVKPKVIATYYYLGYSPTEIVRAVNVPIDHVHLSLHASARRLGLSSEASHQLHIKERKTLFPDEKALKRRVLLRLVFPQGLKAAPHGEPQAAYENRVYETLQTLATQLSPTQQHTLEMHLNDAPFEQKQTLALAPQAVLNNAARKLELLYRKATDVPAQQQIAETTWAILTTGEAETVRAYLGGTSFKEICDERKVLPAAVRILLNKGFQKLGLTKQEFFKLHHQARLKAGKEDALVCPTGIDEKRWVEFCTAHQPYQPTTTALVFVAHLKGASRDELAAKIDCQKGSIGKLVDTARRALLLTADDVEKLRVKKPTPHVNADEAREALLVGVFPKGLPFKEATTSEDLHQELYNVLLRLKVKLGPIEQRVFEIWAKQIKHEPVADADYTYEKYNHAKYVKKMFASLRDLYSRLQTEKPPDEIDPFDWLDILPKQKHYAIDVINGVGEKQFARKYNRTFAQAKAIIRTIKQRLKPAKPEIPCPPDFDKTKWDILSLRERQVLTDQLAGDSNKEIAHTYGIDTNTVASHKMHAAEKLDKTSADLNKLRPRKSAPKAYAGVVNCPAGIDPEKWAKLTPRIQAIFADAQNGSTRKQLSQKYGPVEHTIGNFITRARKKLGISDAPPQYKKPGQIQNSGMTCPAGLDLNKWALLTENQREILDKYLHGQGVTEIANEKHVGYKSVTHSMNFAMATLGVNRGDLKALRAKQQADDEALKSTSA